MSKTWIKVTCLVSLGLGLVACPFVGSGREKLRAAVTPSVATLAPTWAPTALPESTPVPTAAAGATSTPEGEPIDLSETFPRYSARPAWRALLGWPDECEEGFQLIERQADDEGGLAIYPLVDDQYLAFVFCTLGPYWVEERVYWFDPGADPPAVRPLSVPELAPGDDGWELQSAEVLHGSLPLYDPATQILTNLAPSRGLRDCGTWYRYQWEEGEFVLLEARYQECQDGASAIIPQEWPLIYPAPEQAGPFRRVAAIDPDFSNWVYGLDVLPDGALCVTTDVGYATFRAGVFTTDLLDEGQTPMGVDGVGRMWFVDATGAAVYYWQGDAEPIAAGDGWTPVENPGMLARQGVVTDHLGRAWLATTEDVRVFDGERWAVFARDALGMSPPSNPDYMAEFVLAFAPLQQQVWVGECDWGGPGPMGGGGARWFDGAAWREPAAGIGAECVTAIAADAAGNVWIGLDHGLVWHLAGEEWRQSTLPEPADYRRGYPVSLQLDPSGRPWLWAALCGGASCDATRTLYRLQGDTWVEVAGLDRYPESSLYTWIAQPLLFDGAGTLWLVLQGQVSQVAEDRLVEPPASTLNVWAGATDASGQVWVVGEQEAGRMALWVLEP
ncbi:MAG: DUF1176 domain-containing protein [Anaerolineae bacterium]|nr:DUF1176 domain-containing protein [Anaerolineae bacterium]